MASSAGFDAPSFYPSPSEAALKEYFVGRQLEDVQGPAAVLDAAVVRKNCKLMLEAAEKIGFAFRAHVKTHKTLEITQLQVGSSPGPVKLVGSTVSEVEHLLPWLLECKRSGRHTDILYGVPISPSLIPRLGAIANQLGHGSVGVFVDHPAHIKALDQVSEEVWGGSIPVWVAIDVGYHREGIEASSPQLSQIASALSSSPRTHLAGLYTHLGTSYSSSSPSEALEYLYAELSGLLKGAEAFLKATPTPPQGRVTLSIGASPQATAVQNLLHPSAVNEKYHDLIVTASKTFDLELHAGVYTVNDLQQLATRARPRLDPASTVQSPQTLLSHEDIALRMLVEVASVYPTRTENGPEALVAAGTIALGREPCKSYPGWGVVTPWPEDLKKGKFYDSDAEEGKTSGWIVGRIAQEHGVLTFEGGGEEGRGAQMEMEVGKKVMIWPNHACIASSSFGWFLVIDSDTDDVNTIRDVWIRWRGW